ncbi:MAG: hypothetical protein AAF985_04500 [Bacteroidota bacterium]
MNYRSFALLFLSFLSIPLFAQAQEMDKDRPVEVLPYHQIPEAPDSYSAENIAARMVDGLGYRYYWASKDLRPEDLQYKPSEDGKTTQETLEHLLGLSQTVLNAVTQQANIRPAQRAPMTYEEMRKATLENIKQASDQLRMAQAGAIENFEIVFQRGEKKSTFPFWNILNGPLADAIYHTGQIVAFRRASGNPIHPFVNVFIGKTKE